jgi:hypothetical protein
MVYSCLTIAYNRVKFQAFGNNINCRTDGVKPKNGLATGSVVLQGCGEGVRLSFSFFKNLNDGYILTPVLGMGPGMNGKDTIKLYPVGKGYPAQFSHPDPITVNLH